MTEEQKQRWDREMSLLDSKTNSPWQQTILAADAEIARLRAIVQQVDDVLTVNWIAAQNGDYTKALAALVSFCIQIENDPQVSESALKRQNEMDRKDLQISALRAEVEQLRRDKVRLDWFDAPHGCEPMEGLRYDGERQWRYMGIWYDNLRVAIDEAMKEEGKR